MTKPTPEELGAAMRGQQASSVKKARQALRERANEILDKYIQLAERASLFEDFETSAKIYQWLIDHIPEEDGERLVDASVDKKQLGSGKPSGPQINVFQIGGTPSLPALPEPFIESEPIDDDK